MRLYLETANVDQVGDLDRWGCFAGVVTKRESIVDAGIDLHETLKVFADVQRGDVLVEIGGENPDAIEARIRELCSHVPSRLMVMLRATPVGLEVMHRLKDERIWTAATSLVDFGPSLLAANAGADVLIPSFSHMKKLGKEPERTIQDIMGLCRDRGGRPRVLVSNLEDFRDIRSVARCGVWGAAFPLELAFDLLERGSTSSVVSRPVGNHPPSMRED